MFEHDQRKSRGSKYYQKKSAYPCIQCQKNSKLCLSVFKALQLQLPQDWLNRMARNFWWDIRVTNCNTNFFPPQGAGGARAEGQKHHEINNKFPTVQWIKNCNFTLLNNHFKKYFYGCQHCGCWHVFPHFAPKSVIFLFVPNTHRDLHHSKGAQNLANKYHLYLIIFNPCSQFVYLQIFPSNCCALFILGYEHKHTHKHTFLIFSHVSVYRAFVYLHFIFSPFMFVSIGQPMINRLPCMINKYSINLIYGHPLSYPNANISKTQTSMKSFIDFHSCILT